MSVHSHNPQPILIGQPESGRINSDFDRMRQKSMPNNVPRYKAGTPQRHPDHAYSAIRPWMRNKGLQQNNHGNYSLAPSKIYMGHNTGFFKKNETEISKQRREQSRELREA